MSLQCPYNMALPDNSSCYDSQSLSAHQQQRNILSACPDLFFVNLPYLSCLWFCSTEVKWSMFFILYVSRGATPNRHWTASYNLKVKAGSPCCSSFFLVDWFIVNKHICWRISLLSNIANESFFFLQMAGDRETNYRRKTSRTGG